MNNNNQSLGEMAEIAEQIISDDFNLETPKYQLVQESEDNFTKFINNYNEMTSLLSQMQNHLEKASKNQPHSKLMGDGSILKAKNLSSKLSLDLAKTNETAKNFISAMRKCIGSL